MSDEIPNKAPLWPPSRRLAPVCADPIVEAVRDKLRQRSAVGQIKYGATLDRADLTTVDWFRHVQEEALDLSCSLERLIRDLARLEDDGR